MHQHWVPASYLRACVTRHKPIYKILTFGDFRKTGPRYERNRQRISFARATCTRSWAKMDGPIRGFATWRSAVPRSPVYPLLAIV
jgi:hypothetical protein